MASEITKLRKEVDDLKHDVQRLIGMAISGPPRLGPRPGDLPDLTAIQATTHKLLGEG